MLPLFPTPYASAHASCIRTIAFRVRSALNTEQTTRTHSIGEQEFRVLFQDQGEADCLTAQYDWDYNPGCHCNRTPGYAARFRAAGSNFHLR